MATIAVIDHHDPRQAERMRDLQRASYRSEADLIGFEQMPPLVEDVADITRLDLIVFGATERESLVGIVGYRSHGASVDIDRLAVHPSRFRSGVGRKLVEALHSREAGATRFTVSTGAENLPAVGLYEALGYDLVSEEIAQGLRIAHFTRHLPAGMTP